MPVKENANQNRKPITCMIPEQVASHRSSFKAPMTVWSQTSDVAKEPLTQNSPTCLWKRLRNIKDTKKTTKEEHPSLHPPKQVSAYHTVQLQACIGALPFLLLASSKGPAIAAVHWHAPLTSDTRSPNMSFQLLFADVFLQSKL